MIEPSLRGPAVRAQGVIPGHRHCNACVVEPMPRESQALA